jgi:hypothetical protein
MESDDDRHPLPEFTFHEACLLTAQLGLISRTMSTTNVLYVNIWKITVLKDRHRRWRIQTRGVSHKSRGSRAGFEWHPIRYRRERRWLAQRGHV